MGMPNSKIANAIKENIIKPELKNIAKDDVGVVIRTYHEEAEKNGDGYNIPFVDVKVLDRQTETKRVMTNVPVLSDSFSSSISGRRLREGDKVRISYYRSNYKFPQIVGRVYTDLETREKELSSNKGADIADAYGYF